MAPLAACACMSYRTCCCRSCPGVRVHSRHTSHPPPHCSSLTVTGAVRCAAPYGLPIFRGPLNVSFLCVVPVLKFDGARLEEPSHFVAPAAYAGDQKQLPPRTNHVCRIVGTCLVVACMHTSFSALVPILFAALASFAGSTSSSSCPDVLPFRSSHVQSSFNGTKMEGLW
jgi:hypothetical protein